MFVGVRGQRKSASSCAPPAAIPRGTHEPCPAHGDSRPPGDPDPVGLSAARADEAQLGGQLPAPYASADVSGHHGFTASNGKPGTGRTRRATPAVAGPRHLQPPRHPGQNPSGIVPEQSRVRPGAVLVVATTGKVGPEGSGGAVAGHVPSSPALALSSLRRPKPSASGVRPSAQPQVVSRHPPGTSPVSSHPTRPES